MEGVVLWNIGDRQSVVGNQGSLREAQAAIHVAIAWGYVSELSAREPETVPHRRRQAPSMVA